MNKLAFIYSYEKNTLYVLHTTKHELSVYKKSQYGKESCILFLQEITSKLLNDAAVLVAILDLPKDGIDITEDFRRKTGNYKEGCELAAKFLAGHNHRTSNENFYNSFTYK